MGFVEEDEPLPFLYDNERSYIVREADESIPRYKQYRRYSRMLDSRDYSFSLHFIAPTAEELREIAQPEDEAQEEPTASAMADMPAFDVSSVRPEAPAETEPRLSDETSLRETELSLRIRNVLARTKEIYTVGELRVYIAKQGIQALERLRYLGTVDREKLEAFIYEHKLDKTEE